jgi:hypothetical protein
VVLSPLLSRQRTHRLASCFQPGLADAVEPQLGRGAVSGGLAESTQPPDVSVVLGGPSGFVGEIFDLASPVDDQRSRPAVLRSRPTQRGPPGLLVPVQQRDHRQTGQQPHHPSHGRHRGLGQLLVAAALQQILDLQLELPAQASQVHGGFTGGHRVGERSLAEAGGAQRVGGGDEVFKIGFTLLAPPALMVGSAQALCSGGAHAPGHRTARAAEHRVAWVEHQHLGTKFGANAGHQLQQTGRPGGELVIG